MYVLLWHKMIKNSIIEEYDENEYEISSFLNLNKRKSVGEHLTNFNIIVRYDRNIVNQIKLNYIDDYFIAYKRFSVLSEAIKNGKNVRNEDEYNDVIRINDLYERLTKNDDEEKDLIQDMVKKVVSFLGEGMDDESKKQ